MTPEKLEAAGWKRRGPGVWLRDDAQIMVSLESHTAPELRAQLIAGAFSTHGDYVPSTRAATKRALASLGKKTMPNGKTVRQWALSRRACNRTDNTLV